MDDNEEHQRMIKKYLLDAYAVGGKIYTKTNTNEGVKETSSSNSQVDKSKAKQVDNISRGKNQFDMLNEVDTSEGADMSTLKGRMLVDMFLTKKLQPTCAESSNWSVDMIKYFKDKWESDRLKEQKEQGENVEDLLENMNGIGQTMTGDTVIGLSKGILN
ncbi:hypothetical protein Tco_0729766 [Tanacetum coccineum]|uniref:Uncharacterized protein n=1 Tax=Tanacetum coccineum TaxID=301880 RepID=A0ABQ4YS98_9ASTR